MPSWTSFSVADVIVFVIICGVDVFCAWIFWSAAVMVPKAYQMRRPWMIWLLLIPIPLLNDLLSFIVLIPLARSYQRLFQAHNITRNRQGGFRTVIFTCTVSLLGDLLGFLAHPPVVLKHFFPTVMWFLALPSAAGQVLREVAGVASLALLFIVWDMRKQAYHIRMFRTTKDTIAALHALQG